KIYHPSLVPVLAACLVPPYVSILTEFHPLRDAFSFLQDPRMELTPAHALRMAGEVCKERVPSRTSKQLVEDGSIKIAEYGFQDSVMSPRFGRPRRMVDVEWMAPEVLRERTVADWGAADVYSFGIMLHQIVTRERPYPDMNNMVLAMKVLLESQRPEIPDFIPQQLVTYSLVCFVAGGVPSFRLRQPLMLSPPFHHHHPNQKAQIMELCWQTVPSARISFAKAVELLAAVTF
ncbi:kinase-like domain-containing protein, partial [Blyttiomyces helicus]